MTLGERCDEIVRLIDETLRACAPLRAVSRLPRPEPADQPAGVSDEPLRQTA
jgi:hypothetical protein